VEQKAGVEDGKGAQKSFIVVLATTIFDLVTPFRSSFFNFVL
jgi:hypothetical protein